MKKLFFAIFTLTFFVNFAMAIDLSNFRNGDFEEGIAGDPPHWAGGAVTYGNYYPGYHGSRYAVVGGLRSSMVSQELLLKPNTSYTIKFVAAIGRHYFGQNVSIIDGADINGEIIKQVDIRNKAFKTGLIEYTINFRTSSGLGATAPVTVKISPMAGIMYVDYFRLIDNSNSENNEYFEKRYYNNLKGNIKIVGNSVLKSNVDNGKSNAELILKYIDIDSNSNTFNSSSANIDSIVDGIDIKKSKIVWAGLYWVGYLHNDQADEGIDNIYNFSTRYRTTAKEEIKNTLENQEVLFKIDNGNYITIKPDVVNRYLYRYEQYYSYHYGYISYVSYIYNAFADVTDILKGKSANHKFTVANIPTREGRTWNGNIGDGLGNFGAWTLVVVYDNSSKIDEKMRNITIFDGLKFVTAESEERSSVTIDFKGFKTPRYAPDGVDSKISIFAAEGDKYILGDGAILTNQDGEQYELPNATGTNSYFASSIDGVPSRNPKIANNNGIDIHINNIGTKYGDDKPIKVNQDSASLTMYTIQDAYVPTMVAFSTELYTPKLCYDYTLRLNTFSSIPSQDREFKINAMPNDELMFKVMIRSQEADFDLTHSKQYITFTPNKDVPFNFEKAQVSYSNSNRYNDVTPIDATKGIIPIGKHIDSTGGTIGAKERMYSKTFYKSIDGGTFEGRFDINIEGNISFDGVHDVHYLLSTSASKNSPNYLPRCPTNTTYDPIYGMFNVENGNATFNQSIEDRYSLPTQVAGVPYKVTVASYDKDSSGKYTVPKRRTKNFEVEIIDAGNFENNSTTGYDATCEDPDSYSKGAWVKLKNQSRISLEIPKDYPEYPKNLALRKAAFRSWILIHTDARGIRVDIPVNCTSQSDGRCFRDIYDIYYKNYDDKIDKFCQNDCSSANDANTKCYDCLRQYYAKPVCSRDIFAIRPDGFIMTLRDNNQSDNYTDNIVTLKNSYANQDIANLAAGYKYVLDVNATTYEKKTVANSVDANSTIDVGDNALGYYFIDDNQSKNISKLFFNDSSSCIDRNDTILNLYLRSGATEHFASDMSKSVNILKGPNAGKYYAHIEDNKWTEVDQVGYPYRPFPNHLDCELNSANRKYGQLVAIRGCTTTSKYDNYNDLFTTFHPYDLDISSIDLSPSLGFIYFNDLNKTKYLIDRDEVMAIALKGKIKALSYDNKKLSNYTEDCAAKDLNINIDYMAYKYIDENNRVYANIKDSLGRDVALQHSLYNNKLTLNNSVQKQSVGNTTIAINFNKEQFVDRNSTLLNGETDFREYINFNRDYNVPINPFIITIEKLRLSSPNDKFFVEMKSYDINKSKDYYESKYVYYAKVKSKSNFYDDIEENEINTPMMVTIFCNENIDRCQYYGIDTRNSATDEYDWWISTQHNSMYGNIELRANEPSKVIVNPYIVNSFENGVNKDVIVKDIRIAHRPYLAKIKATSHMIDYYPWLLYNKDKNAVPNYIYKVRFINKPTDHWSGGGGTGYTIDVNASNRRTKKIEW